MTDNRPSNDGMDKAHQSSMPDDDDRNAPKKREPIFNQMPLGVAFIIGAILSVHIVLLLAGADVTRSVQTKFGVVPAAIDAYGAQNQIISRLIPLIVHQFLHGGPLHLVMNLAMLLQAGPIAEMGLSQGLSQGQSQGQSQGMGRGHDRAIRFVVFFVATGICSGLFYSWLNPGSTIPTIGASGAISGVFAGFLWAAIGLAKPGQAVLRPVLVSGAIFLLINVGLAWVGRVLNVVPIAWESHLGGFLSGLIIYPLIVRLGRSNAHIS